MMRGPRMVLLIRYWSNFRRLQGLFLALLVVTMVMMVILSMTTVPPSLPQIRYALNHRFLTCRDCLDGRRIGNLMFNYAALVGIAKRNNMTAILPDSFYLWRIFELKMRQVPAADLERFVTPSLTHEEFGRRSCAYDMQTERLAVPYNFKLVGYFQSWRYFENAEAELRDHFRFQAPIIREAREFLSRDVPGKLQGMDMVKVGIQVRRGDILQQRHLSFGYNVADATYFKKAMAYFVKLHPKVVFIACSDDMAWTKRNVVGDNLVYSEGHSAPVDLAILSLCDHTIVSVGSYSWWAGWLANGTTVYYGKWPRSSSILQYHVDKKQYFPPSWLPIS